MDLVQSLVERRQQVRVQAVEEHLLDQSGVTRRGLAQRLLALGGERGVGRPGVGT